MKDLVIIMLLGFCQNVPRIYARKQQSAAEKQTGFFLLFLSFIMLGTSTAITDLVSKPFSRDRECLSHSPSSGTGRCCSSESLSKERGGNSLKSLLQDNHKLEVISTGRL